MAEDKKTSPKRTSRSRGLFSGPADPLLGGMGAPPRPKRNKKPALKKAASKASPSPTPEQPPPGAAPVPAPPEPAQMPERPPGISLSEQPRPKAEPRLSNFPASMRLRMAKAKSKAEKLASPPPPPPPEPAPAEPSPEPADDGRRITLPPLSERGTGPASWEEEDEGFDLLQPPSEPVGGLMGMVKDDPSEEPQEDPGFDAPGRAVASLNVIEKASHRYEHQASQEGVDASVWDEPHTDHDNMFDISSRKERYSEDVEEPPSELADLDQLPRGVIIRDERAKDGFTHRAASHTMREDAGVWQTPSTEPLDAPPPTAPRDEPREEPRESRAWWEERVNDENSQQGRVSPLPVKPGPSAPAPSFLGKTRQERDAEKRRRAAVLGGGVSVVVLLIVAAFVALSQRNPAPEPPPKQVMVAPAKDLPPLPEPVEEPPALEPVAELPPEPEAPSDPVDATLPETPNPEPLALLIEPGFLNIRAEPRAVIFLDGENLGQTPLERLELPPGEHTFKAVVPGKRAQVRTIRVDSGQAQRIIFRF